MSQTILQAHDLVAGLRKKTTAPTGPGAITVDPNYCEDTKAAKLVEYAINRKKNCYIVGPTGCGKSSLAINVAARLSESLEIFNCSGETTTDEMIGKPWRKPDGSTVVIQGAAIRAYGGNHGLLLEEVDHANPDILAAMHRLMETNSTFYTMNVGEGEVITKSKSFFVIATANTIGTGEDAFLYAGTKPMNAAFMNRFSVVIKMDYLEATKEVEVLVKKTGINKTIAGQMVATATEARTHLNSASDRIVTPVSTRDLLEWADLVMGAGLSPVEAAPYAFLNRANDSDREILVRLVENTCV